MKIPRCNRYNKILDREDKKFGCIRCQWWDRGIDVPTGWVKQ